MRTNKRLEFITAKAERLRTAVFTDFSTPPVKFPAGVITIFKADSEGNIWFAVTKPFKDTGVMESTFFSQLFCYNKNYDYYVTVQGKTCIVKKDNLPADAIMGKKYLMLKLHVVQAEYGEKGKNKIMGFGSYMEKLLRRLVFTDERANPVHSFRFYPKGGGIL